MNWLNKIFLGDKYLIAFIMLLAIFSLLPGFSASSSIEYAAQTGTVWGQFGKQVAFLVIGLVILFSMQRIDYRYFGGFAILGLPFIVLLLILTLLQGTSIDGANASRWLKLPGIPLSIQTSTLASVVLMVYVARYLTKIRNKKIEFKQTILPLFIPIFVIVGLIFPANGSTAIILFAMVMMLLFLGGFPIPYLVGIGTIILVGAGLFIFAALNYGDQFPNSRVHTWKNRIERFQKPASNSLESWQETNAKAAIVEGGITGKGPGKSAIKHTLPQASSDFIYAVIIEEYGLIGGVSLLFLFLLILFRIIIIGTKIHTYFGSLLAFAIGIPIVFQALINMGVAVGLFPTTGQPLPMISFGGTSLWITCLSFGILLSISRQILPKEEIEKEEKIKSEADLQDIA
ncbi:Cell division protein FtsW [Candidatus Ornithobacterium hominis]|uniref:FtsW/RodA/SpoVE family cell cycle protein n=1 Tax=Candidatus Ornithobacterium hominis TaxID=2497989 RepID=UPI000E5C3C53|nr:FtsW/RodA/SpoVE family cell cycle protein [Candidatus Ornithobacterium hominis]SZD71658.1 Cell division protein FtsW [Candidatus Ornithobacterium hominis]